VTLCTGLAGLYLTGSLVFSLSQANLKVAGGRARRATNGAILRGAGLQGAGFFGKKDRFITKLSSLPKQL